MIRVLHQCQVVMLGETFTGKTSLVLRFAEGRYRESSLDPTVGASFVTKKLTVRGVTAKVQIWDTAGQEQFKKLAPMYYKNASAAIICYDLTSPKSFETLEYWMKELQQNVPSGDIVIAMCATKCDLDNEADTAQAEALAEQTGSIFITTSSKTNSNVQSLFEKVMEKVLEYHGDSADDNSSPPSSPNRSLLDGTHSLNATPVGNFRQALTPKRSPFADEKKADHEDANAGSSDKPVSDDNSLQNANVSRCDANTLMCGNVTGEDGSMGCVIQ